MVYIKNHLELSSLNNVKVEHLVDQPNPNPPRTFKSLHEFPRNSLRTRGEGSEGVTEEINGIFCFHFDFKLHWSD